MSLVDNQWPIYIGTSELKEQNETISFPINFNTEIFALIHQAATDDGTAESGYGALNGNNVNLNSFEFHTYYTYKTTFPTLCFIALGI